MGHTLMTMFPVQQKSGSLKNRLEKLQVPTMGVNRFATHPMQYAVSKEKNARNRNLRPVAYWQVRASYTFFGKRKAFFSPQESLKII